MAKWSERPRLAVAVLVACCARPGSALGRRGSVAAADELDLLSLIQVYEQPVDGTLAADSSSSLPETAKEPKLGDDTPAADSLSSLPDAAKDNGLQLFRPQRHHTSASSWLSTQQAQRVVIKSVLEAFDEAPTPKITLFPWKDLITLSRANAGVMLGDGEHDDANLPPEVVEMMEVMQEFIDYVEDDHFMDSFKKLADGYQENGLAFRQNASALLSKFIADAKGAEEPQVMHKVIKFLDANAMLIHHFVKDMRGKMGVFVQSMPTGLLQTSVELMPQLENITRLIDSPGAAKGHKRDEDLTDLDQFCVHLEPLLKNSEKAVEELKDMVMMVNDSQDSIPVIGRFMDQILPDTPEAKDVSPRVVQLEQQLLDTVYSIVFSLREVTSSYDHQVGHLLHRRLHCNTERDQSGGSLLAPRLAGLLAPLAAMLAWL